MKDTREMIPPRSPAGCRVLVAALNKVFSRVNRFALGVKTVVTAVYCRRKLLLLYCFPFVCITIAQTKPCRSQTRTRPTRILLRKILQYHHTARFRVIVERGSYTGASHYTAVTLYRIIIARRVFSIFPSTDRPRQ